MEAQPSRAGTVANSITEPAARDYRRVAPAFECRIRVEPKRRGIIVLREGSGPCRPAQRGHGREPIAGRHPKQVCSGSEPDNGPPPLSSRQRLLRQTGKKCNN